MGKEHLVREFDLKRPRPCEMEAIFSVWNHVFALFSKSIVFIQAKLGRDIARDKGALCPWIWPQKTLTLANGDHFEGLKSHFCMLVIRMKLGRDIARGN